MPRRLKISSHLQTKLNQNPHKKYVIGFLVSSINTRETKENSLARNSIEKIENCKNLHFVFATEQYERVKEKVEKSPERK